MKIGVCCGEREFNAAGRSGFAYVEMSAQTVRNLDAEALKALRERAFSEGLTIDGFNGFFSGEVSLYDDPLEKITAYAEKNFYAARELGASYCVVGSGRNRFVPEGMDKKDAEAKFMEIMDGIGDKAGQYGVQVILEPLRYAETNLLNTLSEGIAFCRAVGNPNVSCLVDFYHFFMNGESYDIFDTLRPGEITHVHLARPNQDRVYPKKEDAPVLEQWAGLLRKIKYDRRISLECNWAGGFEAGALEAYPNVSMFM
jgi:sugar phosphate isomerase/epimerase